MYGISRRRTGGSSAAGEERKIVLERQKELFAFTAALTTLRREHPVFRRRRFFAGSADHGGTSELGDIAWFQPSGEPMGESAWSDGEAKTVMVFLNGQAIPTPDSRGRRVLDVARERGFKGVVSLRGDSAVALAHEVKPDAIALEDVLSGAEAFATRGG